MDDDAGREGGRGEGETESSSRHCGTAEPPLPLLPWRTDARTHTRPRCGLGALQQAWPPLSLPALPCTHKTETSQTSRAGVLGTRAANPLDQSASTAARSFSTHVGGVMNTIASETVPAQAGRWGREGRQQGPQVTNFESIVLNDYRELRELFDGSERQDTEGFPRTSGWIYFWVVRRVLGTHARVCGSGSKRPSRRAPPVPLGPPPLSAEHGTVGYGPGTDVRRCGAPGQCQTATDKRCCEGCAIWPENGLRAESHPRRWARSHHTPSTESWGTNHEPNA